MLLFSANKDAQIVLFNNSRLDMAISRDFKDRILESADGSKPNLIIDMSNVEYCDSSGLGSLVAIHRELHKKKINLKLSRLQSTIKTLVKLAKLDSIFTIIDDHRDFT